jgi:quercetin dioxygenase-like cupin family protein
MDYGRAIVVDELMALELGTPEAAAAAVYDRPIGLALLHEDPDTGEEHYLVRYPAGLQGRVHRHSSAHTIVVLEGRLEANGRVVGPGAYVHFPAGEPMKHQAAGNEACLFIILFHGPFDVHIVED